MAEVLPFPAKSAAPSTPALFGGFALATAGSLVVGLVTALFRPARNIGPFVSQVTIEETGRDDLEITRHPVELGAAITDHAYKQPSEINIRCGFTASGHLTLGYTKTVYDNFLALQLSRIPMVITTGKRTYQNMLIASISQTTTSETENALMLNLICREVLIVQAQTAKVAAKSQQAAPAATDATTATGDKQPIAKPNVSIARGIGNFLGL